jgi:hypothetical protein
MDINRWKSCAVDIESYTIIRAMGKQGFRRPGSMIAKLVDEEVRKIAKKEGKPYEAMKQNLLLRARSFSTVNRSRVGWLTFKPRDRKGAGRLAPFFYLQ